MLSVEERIKLRDELFESFKKLEIIIFCSSKNYYRLICKRIINKSLNFNHELKVKYDLYVSEFTSEEEAIYCLLHNDDFTNHVCPICKTNQCKFYNKKHGYRETCNNKNCRQKLRENTTESIYGYKFMFFHPDFQSVAQQTKEALYGDKNYTNREKAKETCKERYGTEYPSQLEEFKQKAANTKLIKYGDPYYTNREKAMLTCLERYGVKWYSQTDEFIQKCINTSQERYNVDWMTQSSIVKALMQETCLERYNANSYFGSEDFKRKRLETMLKKYNVEYALQNATCLEKLNQTCLERYGVKWYFQSEDFKRKSEMTCMEKYGVKYIVESEYFKQLLYERYLEKYNSLCPVLITECQPLLDSIEQDLSLYNAYYNDLYFTKFIQVLVEYKNRLLTIKEISELVNRHPTTVEKKIFKLNLKSCFNIEDSKIELFFKDFLINNGFKKDVDFSRFKHILLTENCSVKEIDFLMLNFNIGFEINDIAGHNIKRKNSTYHYNKTLMARDQHNIRLIHLWEWELNKFNWPKISQWILHLLNQSKTEIKQLNAEDLRLVPKSEELQFLNQYSITSYQSDSDICFGIYQNNELIQTLSFKDNILLICLKFNYSISKETSQIIQYYKQFKKLDNILVYVDVSKFTGKTLEDINFKLIDHIEADIINENINEDGEYYQLYNCGYNVYELK